MQKVKKKNHSDYFILYFLFCKGSQIKNVFLIGGHELLGYFILEKDDDDDDGDDDTKKNVKHNSWFVKTERKQRLSNGAKKKKS